MAKGETKADVEVFVPPEALEAVDLEVDGPWLDEVMGSELATFLQEYHKATTALRSARQVGDSRKIDELVRQEAYLRTNIALIQYRHPAAKEIARAIMETQARLAKQGRSALGR